MVQVYLFHSIDLVLHYFFRFGQFFVIRIFTAVVQVHAENSASAPRGVHSRLPAGLVCESGTLK